MTSEAKQTRRRPRRRPAREAFILTAVTLVSLAVGLGLYLQAGLSLMNAAIGGLAIYVGLVCVHVLARRSEAIRDLSDEVNRLENEVMRIARSAGQAAPLPSGPDQLSSLRVVSPPFGGAPQVARPQQATARVAVGSPMDIKSARAAQPLTPPSAGPKAAAPVTVPHVPEPSISPARLEGVSGQPVGSVGPASASRAGGAGPGDSAMARLWSVRPTEMLAEQREPKLAHQLPGPGSSAAEHDPSSPEEVDVEVINGMIKKYSEEIGLAKAPSNSEVAELEADTGAFSNDEAAIEASVDALRAAADEMRRPLESGMAAIERGILPPMRPDSNTPQPPPVGPAQAQLAAIADAISKERLEVYLDPILGLADRKARHFDVSLRLRAGQASIGPQDYMPIARSSGMLPHLEAAAVSRAAMVARHMDERRSGGCLFLRVSAESFAKESFLGEIAAALKNNPRLGERLIFSIVHSELRELTPEQWASLRQLSASGFRFAIDEAVSLDLDLPELRSAGFSFLRLSGRAMLDGISSLDGVLSAAELSQRIVTTGFTLIAVALTSEEQLDGVLGAGVPLGQGPLFGPPRPVKAEALRPAKSAAA